MTAITQSVKDATEFFNALNPLLISLQPLGLTLLTIASGLGAWWAKRAVAETKAGNVVAAQAVVEAKTAQVVAAQAVDAVVKTGTALSAKMDDHNATISMLAAGIERVRTGNTEPGELK